MADEQGDSGGRSPLSYLASVQSAGGMLLRSSKAACRASHEYGWWADRAVRSQIPHLIKKFNPSPTSWEEIVRAVCGVGLPVADAAIAESSALFPGGRPAYKIFKTGVRSISSTYWGDNGVVGVSQTPVMDENKMETVERKMERMEAQLNELQAKVLVGEITRKTNVVNSKSKNLDFMLSRR